MGARITIAVVTIPSLLLDRAPVHAAIGMAVASGSLGGSLPPPCRAQRIPSQGKTI
jgi:hypothetical protein